MRNIIGFFFVLLIFYGCASNVHFIKIDDTYIENPKGEFSKVIISHNKLKRPHHIIGIIEANLNKDARRVELDALLIKKAREVGADAVMLVEYDIDPDVYFEHHHTVVGRGPWRKHIIRSRKRIKVEKTATGIAVIFR